jgi:BirA family biotin operon repressor/biotin-[acetyl-CoA-carboxylase] ligase
MPYFNVIKIDATDSTNSLMRERYLSNNCSDRDVLFANAQLKGRGQHNSVWNSAPGKNLTLSVYREFGDVSLKKPFLISCLVSLAIQAALQSFKIPKIYVKWPNDIMSGNKKICGLLLENIFKGSSLNASIIGIGLNVNQESFEKLPNAASMFQISNKNFDLDEVLNVLLTFLNQKLKLLDQPEEYILKLYRESLYRLDIGSTFEADGQLFSGIIRGVTPNGLLKVQLEDFKLVEFDLKSIQLKN